MFTEKYGTHQCTLMVREQYLQKTQREIPDAIIEQVIRTGDADIDASDLKLIKSIVRAYTDGIFRRLREHGYDENTMRLIVTGGGGFLIEHFATITKAMRKAGRIVRQGDICAAAKGYELMAEAAK